IGREMKEVQKIHYKFSDGTVQPHRVKNIDGKSVLGKPVDVVVQELVPIMETVAVDVFSHKFLDMLLGHEGVQKKSKDGELLYTHDDFPGEEFTFDQLKEKLGDEGKMAKRKIAF